MGPKSGLAKPCRRGAVAPIDGGAIGVLDVVLQGYGHACAAGAVRQGAGGHNAWAVLVCHKALQGGGAPICTLGREGNGIGAQAGIGVHHAVLGAQGGGRCAIAPKHPQAVSVGGGIAEHHTATSAHSLHPNHALGLWQGCHPYLRPHGVCTAGVAHRPPPPHGKGRCQVVGP